MRLAKPVVALALLGTSALLGCGGDDDGEEQEPSQAKPEVAAQEATTPSGQKVRLSVAVEPAKASTSGRPSPVTVGYAVSIGTRTGAKPNPAKQISFRAQQGFKLNAAEFPTCSVDDLEAGRLDRCANAKIGEGTAEVIPPKGGRLKSRISTFNGERRAGKATFLFYIQTPGYDPIAAPATVSTNPQGPYGYSIDYPPISDALPLARLEIRTLDKTVTRGGREVHLIEAPSSCGGSWRFQSQTWFRAGEKVVVSDTAPCSS
jgi:hypothetical protein